MQLFGTSGIRKIADKNLAQLALKVGLAVGSVYHNVVIGCDTRTSNQAIKHAVMSGLLTAGSKCCDDGVIPTPTLALAASEFDAGAMITASHNPPEYNGIKLLNPDGSAFDAFQRKEIEDIIANDSCHSAPWERIMQGTASGGAIEQHIDRILRQFPTHLGLRVVVDCACGATCGITPYLLTRLGCEVVGLNCYPSGFFPHDVEPIEANFGNLMKATREYGAALGIAHDGDGDRMMAIDDRGRFISGDKLMLIFARELGAKEIVTTVDASMAVEEMGFATTRTMVGDIYVSDELKKGGKFGGEPSGSWVFPAVSLCPDGVYAAAQIAVIASQQRLSTLVDNIPEYPILRGSVRSDGTVMSHLEQRLLEMSPSSISNVDGIKLNFEDGWILVRASGTEPKIRITTEARSEPRLRHLYDRSLSIIRDCMEAK